MKQTRISMGTPVTVEVSGAEASQELFEEVFAYFQYVDATFSTYKDTSEITALNKGRIQKDEVSDDMKLVLSLAEETKRLTNGYFDIVTLEGSSDPSGLVKGWAIFNATQILRSHQVTNFYVEAGGDIQVSGTNTQGTQWAIGIQNPFTNQKEIIKTVYLKDKGIATSGSYVRGQHIYDPVDKKQNIEGVISITVIGPNVFEADRFATAAFAMGTKGVHFIESLSGFEGYSIDTKGTATMTTGFADYLTKTYA